MNKTNNKKASSNRKDKSNYGTLTDVPGTKVESDKLTQSLVP